jgi:O-antigen ligase
MNQRPGAELLARSFEVLGSTRMTAVISVTAIGLAFTARLDRALMGWPALAAAIAVLVALSGGSLFARRASLEWRGLLPISLLTFVGWCALTLVWSDHRWASASGIAYQIAFLALGVYVALVRDLIQIIRAVGDVVRFALVISFVLEIFSGLLVDSPIRFLGIEGNLGSGLPIQGIFGVRNQLGLVALIGLITFTAELLTRSVSRTVAIFSLCFALLGLALTRSPVVAGATIAAVIMAAAMLGLRHLQPATRRFAQFGLLALSVLAVIVTWATRTQIIAALNAGSEFETRYDLWRVVLGYVQLRPLEGWSWVGLWSADLPPFNGVNALDGHQHASALNAFVDVLFQTGMVGLACFVLLAGLTFARSWLLAANQRSVVFVWPAIVLVALLVTSLAESTILVEFGWMLFVVCAVAAAHRLSWRRNYAADETDPGLPGGRGDA